MEEQGSSRSLLIIAAVAGLSLLGYYYFFNKPTQPSTGGGAGDHGGLTVREDAARRAARHAQEQTARIETDEMIVTVSTLNASVVHVQLKGARYRDARGAPMDVVTTDREEYYPLHLDLAGVPIPADATWSVDRLTPRALRFSWHGGGFTVVRRLEAGGGPYELWSTVTVTNESAAERPVRVRVSTFHYVPRKDEKGGFFAARSPAITRGICRHDDSTKRFDRKDLYHAQTYATPRYGPPTLTGLENSYFANVLATDGSAGAWCRMRTRDWVGPGTAEDPDGTLYEIELAYPRATLAPHASTTVRTLSYIGPKDAAALSRAGHAMSSVLDLGFFSIIARGMVKLLSTIHSVVGNWGLAIMLMTVLVKVVLFPLTLPQLRSMAKMRALKPEIDRVNELYGNDREKKGAATMELYRKNGINPVAGCLPALMQLPVWWALYTSLSTNIALYHEPFGLWLRDLSSPDPYFIMPLLLGVAMFVQQRITPTTGDPTQAKIMQWVMPIMITSFMLFLPQGLTVYMLTNSVLSICQQQFVEWRIRTILRTA